MIGLPFQRHRFTKQKRRKEQIEQDLRVNTFPSSNAIFDVTKIQVCFVNEE